VLASGSWPRKKLKQFSWEFGSPAYFAWGDILTMNNFALFICGIIVTLMCGMGVLVYMVSLGYKKQQVKVIPKFVEPLSSAQIPSPS
jgi:hypothetical protein